MVVIAQLAQRLTAHPSWSGVGWFVFLFCAVWSSWINGTLYYDLNGTNDVSVRLFTFFQMLAVAVMAVFVHDVPGDGAHGFALGFAANTVVLVVNAHRDGPLLGVPIAAGLTVWVVHLDALELDE